MPDSTEIVNTALDEIGQATIENIDGTDANSKKAKRAYELFLPQLLKDYPWRFAHKRVNLAVHETAPTSDIWNYQYQLPSDCLQPRFINEDYEGRISWQQEGDKILTNETGPILLEYTKLETNPNVWSGSFVIAFQKLLASSYAGIFKHDHRLAGQLFEMHLLQLAQAKTADARAASVEAVSVPILTTDVRRF